MKLADAEEVKQLKADLSLMTTQLQIERDHSRALEVAVTNICQGLRELVQLADEGENSPFIQGLVFNSIKDFVKATNAK
jgi:hypothetical protein